MNSVTPTNTRATFNNPDGGTALPPVRATRGNSRHAEQVWRQKQLRVNQNAQPVIAAVNATVANPAPKRERSVTPTPKQPTASVHIELVEETLYDETQVPTVSDTNETVAFLKTAKETSEYIRNFGGLLLFVGGAALGAAAIGSTCCFMQLPHFSQNWMTFAAIGGAGGVVAGASFYYMGHVDAKDAAKAIKETTRDAAKAIKETTSNDAHAKRAATENKKAARDARIAKLKQKEKAIRVNNKKKKLAELRQARKEKTLEKLEEKAGTTRYNSPETGTVFVRRDEVGHFLKTITWYYVDAESGCEIKIAQGQVNKNKPLSRSSSQASLNSAYSE